MSLPTVNTLPSKTIEEFFKGGNVVTKSDRLALLDKFGVKEHSMREVLRERVSNMLSSNDMYLLPYILEKMWIGDKLIYTDNIEQAMSSYI